jgi:hypothetical protein
MKKVILYMCALAATQFSCQSEDADFVYDSKNNIYFGIGTTPGLTMAEVEDLELLPPGMQDPRKMFYSFAENQKAIDTVYIPVTISGLREPRERRFKAAIVSDSTTASAELHFKTLQEYYTIPADSGSVLFPLILINKDPEMEQRTFQIKLELIPSEDFDVSVPESKYAKVMFSNRLEEPVWWITWSSDLGAYSRTKHALYLIALGDEIENKNLTTSKVGDQGLLNSYCLFLIAKFNALLINPRLWVEDHPEYVMPEVEPGKFDFYNVNNTNKKYRLVINQNNKYVFLDENGKEIVTGE